MQTTAEHPEETTDRIPSPPPGEDSDSHRLRLPRLSPIAWIAIAGVILALGSIGFLILDRGASTDEISTVGDFLEPGTELDSVADRLQYGTAAGYLQLDNGGVVPLTDELNLGVSLDPFPPTSFDVEVDLFLTTADGGAVSEAEIFAVWDMAVMSHGPFETAFENHGDGHFTARFDMSMFGPWQVVTHITAAGYVQPEPLPLSVYVWPE